MLTTGHNLLKSELKEMLRSLSFWLGSVVTAILMGTQGFLPKDSKGYSMKNIWEALFSERKLPTEDSLVTLITTGHMGVYTYFIPLLASFCYLAFQVQYRSFGFERIVKIRLSKKTYRFGSYVVALLIGGITLTVGHFLYVIAVSVIAGVKFGLFLDWSCVLYILRSALEAFLAGMFWNSLVYVLLHLVRNIYLLGTLPFLLKYAWGCIENLIFLNMESPTERVMDLVPILDDNGIYLMFSLGKKGIFILFLLMVCLCINYQVAKILERRQIDYGM